MISQLIAERPGAEGIAPASLDEAVSITDFIHMSTGSSNSYLINTADGDVLINTGMGFEAGRHKRLYEPLRSGPLRYILITQGHVDHVGGVDTFKEPGTVLVAHETNALCQADDERIESFRQRRSFVFFPDLISEAIRILSEDPSIVQSKPTPDLLVGDRHELEVGGRRFELLSVPGGETRDSLVVWMPEESILFSGNAIGPLFPHFPNLYTIRGDKYRFMSPYLEALQRIIDLGPELLITGHFEPIRGKELIKAALERIRDASTWVHERTLEAMNEGKDLYEAMREIKLPAELEVGQGYGKVPWAVRAIYEGSAGWFRMRATSELYPVAPEEAASDLVALAGGAGPVVERAAAKFEAGDILAALGLVEAALAHDSSDTSALKLSLAIHERLLVDSGGENFWEVRWLEHVIRETRALIGEEG